MADTFQHEQVRQNLWRIVRITANGERFPLSQRFTKEHTAARRAYELQVGYERRQNRRVYLGD